jgi:hypothetical protein
MSRYLARFRLSQKNSIHLDPHRQSPWPATVRLGMLACYVLGLVALGVGLGPAMTSLAALCTAALLLPPADPQPGVRL